MIFVTVGTHEQPFNRLLEYVDKLKEQKVITEEVIMQTGFSTYTPKHCKYQKLFSYQRMNELVEEARIVITHGGPSSFLMVLQKGKIPVVVPRQKQFDEHVNDHQVEFVKQVEDRQGNIIAIEDINNLGYILLNYGDIVESMKAGMNSNNKIFNRKFEKIVNTLLDEK